ncbi:ribonucleoside triphosphate reductase, partial [Candidatus Gottesmanbacteria bacterium]|nr:ribonucleoside triphosphate reductase [Candidatus Gottesmanbacteria bacterium]
RCSSNKQSFSSNKKDYFERLSHMMDLAKEALLLKRAVVEKFTEEGLYPYSKVYLSGIKDRFGEYWKNHFNTIGLIGMNESLLNFMGKTIGEEDGRNFALEVLDFMRTKLLIYQKETDLMFNLEATPAEGTSYSLAKIDKKTYPKIIVGNEEEVREGKAEPYYTNSTHLPVNFSDDLFEALNLQDDLQTKYTGGTVLHGFLGESMPDTASVKKLVSKIAQNYHLPYYTLTPTFSVCPSHGYLKGEVEKCPKCGKACEIWSRVVGYLRPVVQWNAGKQAEFTQRRTYDRQLHEF